MSRMLLCSRDAVVEYALGEAGCLALEEER